MTDMNIAALKPALNPHSVHPSDRFLIVNRDQVRIVESWGSRQKADLFCRALNDHEVRNNRKPVYDVIERPLE